MQESLLSKLTLNDFIAISSAAIALFAAFISYYSFHRTLRAASKPVLIFSMTSNFRWRIENVGTGPAINIAIGDKDRSGDFVSVTNCYPLSAGNMLELSWTKAAQELVAVYTDVYGKTFTTICNGNLNRIINKNQFPDWKITQDQWFQLILAEGKEDSKLTVEDLKGKTPAELDIMRNEPYAQKGYIFKRKILADYFNKQTWYKPTIKEHSKAFSLLSAGEKYEAHLILEYQNRNGLRTSETTSLVGEETNKPREQDVS